MQNFKMGEIKNSSIEVQITKYVRGSNPRPLNFYFSVLKYQPKGREFDPRTYLVICTSIEDLFISPILKFCIKLYIPWVTLYAQPENFI